MFSMTINPFNDQAQSDDFRASAEDRQNFHEKYRGSVITDSNDTRLRHFL
jgi:hypothetical protein